MRAKSIMNKKIVIIAGIVMALCALIALCSFIYMQQLPRQINETYVTPSPTPSATGYTPTGTASPSVSAVKEVKFPVYDAQTKVQKGNIIATIPEKYAYKIERLQNGDENVMTVTIEGAVLKISHILGAGSGLVSNVGAETKLQTAGGSTIYRLVLLNAQGQLDADVTKYAYYNLKYTKTAECTEGNAEKAPCYEASFAVQNQPNGQFLVFAGLSYPSAIGQANAIIAVQEADKVVLSLRYEAK